MLFRTLSPRRFGPILNYALMVLITASCGVQQAAEDAVSSAKKQASASGSLPLTVTVTTQLRSTVAGGGTNGRIKRHLRGISSVSSVATNEFAGKNFWISPSGAEAPDPATTEPSGTVGMDGSINSMGFSGKDTIIAIEDPNLPGHYVKALVKSDASGVTVDPISFGQYDAAVNAGLDPEDSKFAAAGMAAALDKAAETAVISSVIDEKMAAAADDLATCGSSGSESLSACAGAVVGASTSLLSDIELAAVQSKGVSPEDVVKIVTRAGFSVSVDMFLFQKFGLQLEAALGTDFVSGIKPWLIGLAQRAASGNGASDTTQVLCVGGYSAFMRGGQFSYVPAVKTDGTTGIQSLSCNNPAEIAKNLNLAATHPKVVQYGTLSDSGNGGQVKIGSVDCNTPEGWRQQNYFCAWPARLVISSKVTEVNRNDPEGEHPRGNGGGDDDNVSFIDVTQNFMDGLMSDSNSVPCLGLNPQNGEGNPDLQESNPVCTPWFNTFISQHKNDFVGLFGFYLMLNKPELYGGAAHLKLSLQDIHDIFVNPGYLNYRVGVWGPGLTSRNYNNGQNWANPLLKVVNGTLRIQDVFRMDAQNTSDSAVQAAVDAATLPYDFTFSMFEHIPSMEEIRSFVFGKAHHEEFNPSGPKYFWASGAQNSGKPVVCRMLSKASGKASSQELSSDSKLDCLTDLTQLTPDPSDASLFNGADQYPYVLMGYGWRGDDNASPLVLTERRTGRRANLGGNQDVIILPVHPGNSEACKTSSHADKIINANMVFGMGDQQQQQAVKAYCADLSAFTVSGQLNMYWGGNLTVKGRDGSGQTWEWQAQQMGGVDPANIPAGVRPLCYFAGSSSLSTSNGIITAGAGVTVGASGNLTSLFAGDVIGPCSESHPSLTKYYLIMMGEGSSGAVRASLRAYLMSSGDSPQMLSYRNWAPSDTRWEDMLMNVRISLLESASGLRVAPLTAPTFMTNLQIRNIKNDPKFDPYCDDLDGNGKCDCKDAVTHVAKDADSCTLEDEAAEPTLSQPLWWPGQQGESAIVQFFHDFGGKSGADLEVSPGHGLDGSYLNSNQIWIPIDQAFQCKFKNAGGVYLKPQYLHWEDFRLNHAGCPASDGGVANAGTQGPVRLVNPVPARNAYDIEYPNTMMGLIGMATAPTGVGVDISPTEKIFTIDSALALIKLRSYMPVDAPIYNSDGTHSSGMFPMYQRVRTNTGSHMNPLTSVQAKLTGN